MAAAVDRRPGPDRHRSEDLRLIIAGMNAETTVGCPFVVDDDHRLRIISITNTDITARQIVELSLIHI